MLNILEERYLTEPFIYYMYRYQQAESQAMAISWKHRFRQIRFALSGYHLNRDGLMIVATTNEESEWIRDEYLSAELQLISDAIYNAIGNRPKRVILAAGMWQATFEGDVSGIVHALRMRGFVGVEGSQWEGDGECLVTFKGIGKASYDL